MLLELTDPTGKSQLLELAKKTHAGNPRELFQAPANVVFEWVELRRSWGGLPFRHPSGLQRPPHRLAVHPQPARDLAHRQLV